MENTRKRKGNFFLRTALVAFSCYMIVLLVQVQLEIRDRKEQIQKLDESIQYQRQLNADMRDKQQNYESYLEQIARENGLALPGETIFKEAPGNG